MNKVKELTTDAAIKQRYDQFAKEQSEKEEIKARHILVATEAEAKTIEEELKKGGNFEEIAKNKSSDSSKSKGGDLGYFSKGQMVKQFEDAAFALKTGEISAPVKSDFGWHIIKVEDRRKMAVPSFEEVKQKFQDEVGQKAMQDYIKKLQSDAHIELKLSNAPAAAPKDAPSTAAPADAPKDAPSTTAPADAPKDAPSTTAPAADAPKDAPSTTAPAADAPNDAPSTTAPAADAPKDAPSTTAPAAGNTTDDKNKGDTKSDNTAK